MKTIRIKNGLFWGGNVKLKVLINGEERIMQTQFLNVDVDENASFEIKVIKRGWLYSPIQKFEPKDNMLLQISVSRRIEKRHWLFFLLGAALALIIGYFYGNGRFAAFIPSLMLLLPAIYMTIIRKKRFVISEK